MLQFLTLHCPLIEGRWHQLHPSTLRACAPVPGVVEGRVVGKGPVVVTAPMRFEVVWEDSAWQHVIHVIRLWHY